MKLKTDITSTEEQQEETCKKNPAALKNYYREIIKTRLIFIEESLSVINEAFAHLDDSNEDDD